LTGGDQVITAVCAAQRHVHVHGGEHGRVQGGHLHRAQNVGIIVGEKEEL
jgi:hypothetical protein